MQRKSGTVSTSRAAEDIDDLERLLDAGKRVRQTLPSGTRIHIDGDYPFVFLYRAPSNRPDAGAEELVTGEASFIVAATPSSRHASVSRLLRRLAHRARAKFGAFLVVEIWTGTASEPKSSPQFLLLEDQSATAAAVLDTLEAALTRIRVSSQAATVTTVQAAKEQSQRPKPPLSAAELQALGCCWIGIQTAPVFRAGPEGPVYPRVLRSFRASLGGALRKAAHRFCEDFTSYQATGHLSLGRRSLAKAVWASDAQLAEIANEFDFLIAINPVNTAAAWHAFRKSSFDRAPHLRYRPLSLDLSIAKRRLYQTPIDRVEEPSVANLLLDKQAELDRQLTMLSDRATRRFILGSQQLYGPCTKSLLRAAEEILEHVPARADHGRKAAKITAEELCRQAKGEFAAYEAQWGAFEGHVSLAKNVVAGLMVSRGRLMIAEDALLLSTRADALMQHEVGTHMVTFFNGKAQRFQLLAAGLPGYDELQEGLAVLAEYLVGGLTAGRLRTIAARVLVVRALIDGATFVDAFRLLLRMGFPRRAAFNVTVRVYRGGGFTKDMIYLRGFQSVLDYLRAGKDLSDLYLGKIALSHLPLLLELKARSVLRPAPLRPRFLDRPEAQARLRRLIENDTKVHQLCA